jgi:hypothetical protein
MSSEDERSRKLSVHDINVSNGINKIYFVNFMTYTIFLLETHIGTYAEYPCQRIKIKIDAIDAYLRINT